MIDKSDGEEAFSSNDGFEGEDLKRGSIWPPIVNGGGLVEHQEFTSSPSIAGSFAFILNSSDMGGFRMRQQLDGRHIR